MHPSHSDNNNNSGGIINMSQWTRRDWLAYSLGSLVLLFLLYNSLVRDYKAETRTYLTSIGKKDAIDKVVPRSYDEVRQERLRRDAMVDQLAANVSQLVHEMKHLRNEVDNLKQKQQLPPVPITSPTGKK